MHSMSQPNIHHTTAPPPPPQHSLSQSNIHPYMAQAQSQPSFVRPIARVPVPAFMGIENFQMTDRLMAEIDHAHYVSASGTAYGAPPNTHQPPDLSGTSGVAYAGGASSNSIPKAHFESGSPPKDPVMERLRAAEWNGTKEQEGGQRGGVMAGRRDVRDKDRDNREREREREGGEGERKGEKGRGKGRRKGRTREREREIGETKITRVRFSLFPLTGPKG